jgi:hypothetical protein
VRCYLLGSKNIKIIGGKMEKCIKEIAVNTADITKIKERAALLAGSINRVREQGISINPHEPIEGKMYWFDN